MFFAISSQTDWSTFSWIPLSARIEKPFTLKIIKNNIPVDPFVFPIFAETNSFSASEWTDLCFSSRLRFSFKVITSSPEVVFSISPIFAEIDLSSSTLKYL